MGTQYPSVGVSVLDGGVSQGNRATGGKQYSKVYLFDL